MKLTVEEQRLLPTEEDVAIYREHGWYISKKVLTVRSGPIGLDCPTRRPT